MKNLPLAASLLCLAPMTSAETLTPEIVVSATRAPSSNINTPANIQVIDRQMITESGARHVSELLRTQAGIHVSDAYTDGSTASIDMRGFGPTASSNTIVMVDGRKLNSSTDKSTLYMNSVSLSNIERIEIIQGSAGVLFGNQAVGGVINIITRQPDDQQIDVSADIGSFNSKSLSIHASNRLDNGFGYQVSIRGNKTDNYRDNNQSDLKNMGLLLDYKHDNGRVFVEYNKMDDTTHGPGALLASEVAANRQQSTTNFSNDFIKTDSDFLRLGANQQLTEHWSLQAETSRRVDDVSFILSSLAFGAGSLATQDRTTKTFTPRLIGKYATAHGNTDVTVGFDYEHTDYEINGLAIQTSKQSIKAIYAQVDHPVTEKLNATFGLRHAKLNNAIVDPFSAFNGTLKDDVTVGSAGLSFKATPHWRLFARADQNYRFGKLEELTSFITFTPTDLKTQTGISYESGIEFKKSGTELTAQIYRLNLKNEIAFDSSGFSNINIDKTQRNGLSLSASQEINRNWSVGASYDYIDNEVTSGPLKGNQIPGVSNHEARVFANWIPSSNTLLGAEVHYVSKQTLSGDFTNTQNKLAAYTVVNINAHYYIDNWDISARINNVFNHLYSETGAVGFGPIVGFNPAAERNFWMGARYSFE